MNPQKKIYESLKQAATSENIPLTWLQAAKNVLGAPGFRGSRVDWHILGPWIEEHRDELEDIGATTTDEVKRQNLIKDGILKDLQIAEKKRQFLNPQEVREWINGFGVTLSAVIKKKRQSLMSKCAGYEGLIDSEFIEIFDQVGKELKRWNQQ